MVVAERGRGRGGRGYEQGIFGARHDGLDGQAVSVLFCVLRSLRFRGVVWRSRSLYLAGSRSRAGGEAPKGSGVGGKRGCVVVACGMERLAQTLSALPGQIPRLSIRRSRTVSNSVKMSASKLWAGRHDKRVQRAYRLSPLLSAAWRQGRSPGGRKG